MKVENMQSLRNYNKIANQFIIRDDKGEYFQSYDSIIVFVPFDRDAKTQLDRDKWNYSRTTAKYRNQFLGETTKETQAKIDSGEYILTNLN